MSLEIRTRWKADNDPFFGSIILVSGLCRETKDYIAVLTGLHKTYEYARLFLHYNKAGVALIPVETFSAAPVEVRMDGKREYFRIVDGKFEPIEPSQIREQIAAYRFGHGMPLHEEEEPAG